jgi:DNA-binding transcriptional LysR family regulator
VPDVLYEFQRQFPSVEVEIVDAGPGELQDFVESDELDAAFGAFSKKISGTSQLEITPATLVLVYSDQFSAIKKRISWQDVFDYPLIALTSKSPVQQLFNAITKKMTADVQPIMRVNHLETALGMVEKGFGVAVFPSFAKMACKRYAVHTAEIYPPASVNYFRIMKAGKEASAAIDCITQLLIAQLHHP